jgi:hypothetical protein
MRALILFLCAVPHLAFASVPQIIHVQGRVSVVGKLHEGPGAFRFALVDRNGTTVYWRNSPDVLPADGMPDAAVSLPVKSGLYSVHLGDTSLVNMAMLPLEIFTNSELWLRIWFDDGSTGPQKLAPDQRIAAVGYALMAAGVQDASITSAKLAGSLDLSAKNLTLPSDVTRLGQTVDLTSQTSGSLSSQRVSYGGQANQILMGDGSGLQLGKGLRKSAGAIQWDESADFQPTGSWDWAASRNFNLLGSRIVPSRSPKKWASLLAAGSQTQTGARAKLVVVGDSIANSGEISEAIKLRVGLIGGGGAFGGDFNLHEQTCAGGAAVVSNNSTLSYTGTHASLPPGGSITFGNPRPLHKIWLAYVKEPGAGSFAIEWQSDTAGTWNRLGEVSAMSTQLDCGWITYDETNAPNLIDSPSASRKRWRVLHTGGGTVRLLVSADSTWQDDATAQRSGALIIGLDKSGRPEGQWKLVDATLARSFWQGLSPDIVMVLTRPDGSPDAADGVKDLLTKVKQWVPQADVVYVSAPPYMDGMVNPETGANYNVSPGSEASANSNDRTIGSHAESIGGYWVDLDPFFEPRSDLNQLYGYYDKIGQTDDGVHLGTVGLRIQAGLVAESLFPISQNTFGTNAAGMQQETMVPNGTVYFRNPNPSGVTLALRSADAFSNNSIVFGSRQNTFLTGLGDTNAYWPGSFAMGVDNTTWNFFGIKSRIGNYTASGQPTGAISRQSSGQLEVFGSSGDHTLVLSTAASKAANRYHIAVAESASESQPGSLEDFSVASGGITHIGGTESAWSAASPAMLSVHSSSATLEGIAIRSADLATANQLAGYSSTGTNLWKFASDGSLSAANVSTPGNLTVGTKTLNNSTPACRWRGAFADPPANPLPGDIYRDTTNGNLQAVGGYLYVDTGWQKLW